MAATQTLPAVHAPFTAPKHSQRRSNQLPIQPFDATVLCEKLEAHKQRQDVTRKRRPQQPQQSQPQPQSQQRAVFVPRSAAAQFAATTTPMPTGNEPLAAQCSSRTPTSNDTNRSVSRVVVSKHTLMAHEMGMSSREALAETDTNAPTRRPMTRSRSYEKPSLASVNHHQQQQQQQQPQSTQPSAVQQSDSANPRKQHRTSRYMPGDAARRNNATTFTVGHVANRQSYLATATTYRHPQESTVKDPWELLLSNPAARAADISSGGSSTPSSTRNSTDHNRPRLSHDRPNWSQESQCGDSARLTLHLPGLHRKAKEVITAAATAEEEKGKGDRPGMKRSGSGGDATLISDAVRIIKKEEKEKRRASIFGMFKRS